MMTGLQGWVRQGFHVALICCLVSGLNASWAGDTLVRSLSDIGSFTVFDTSRPDFSVERGLVPAEVEEYARSAIQKSPLLNYASPAEGVLRFTCEDNACYRVKATLTYGPQGPVVWETTQPFEKCPFVRIHFQPDGRKLATRVIQQLSADYQKAVKATAQRVEIQAEN